MFFKAVSEKKCLIAFLPNKISSFDYNPKTCRRFTERFLNFLYDLERQQRRNAVFIYFLFFKEKKKCICGAFQLDAAVPEKHLYFFLA